MRCRSPRLPTRAWETSASRRVRQIPAQSRELGLNPELLAGFAEWLTELRQQLVATPVVAHPPKGYTPQELQQALAIRLSLEERQWVVNPIEDSPSMQAWARELTANAPDDTAKARALFDALNRRIQFEPGFGARTAREVRLVEGRGGLQLSGICQALCCIGPGGGARSLPGPPRTGLPGQAGLPRLRRGVSRGQCFLADPAYRWFGVPHKSLAVLDDLAVIAHHLEQHRRARPIWPEPAWERNCSRTSPGVNWPCSCPDDERTIRGSRTGPGNGATAGTGSLGLFPGQRLARG